MVEDATETLDEPKAIDGMDDVQDEDKHGQETAEELMTPNEDADEDEYESDENMVDYS